MPHFPLAQVTYKEPPLKGPGNIFWLSFLLFERAHTAVTVAIRGNDIGSLLLLNPVYGHAVLGTPRCIRGTKRNPFAA
jgi:hypothetical protein